ncbi:D-galactonate dehydratase family protein [Streptomyces luomodiensis]|uniref:D-galactonate dehydratase family protein n=1 Tax=Streptomyces luomodiensis TaxID=3026192 RepID=A0ABY9V4D8_9ACTN|nr:D-mannonate dehydratase ManD [Streptomyces sp. SCA4-21]WNE99740.1 D-galactonate dehydratase family protein [Streptomyces sp. SCA4-21]
MSRIERAEVLVASPGRNFVTLRLTTSDGVTGLGDATLNGRELSVAGYLRDHVVPLLIGRDPARIEDMWQYLYRGAYWRRGPVTMTAIAAVDTALWDIKGKVAGLPVYQLLGGRSRDGVLVYSHASGTDVPSLLDDVARFRDLGYQAIRAQAAVPDIGGSYGVRKGTVYEPAAHSLPDEQPWSTEAYLDFAPTYLEAVRDRFGFGFHLLHDVHHRLTPIEAARFGKRVEDYRLFWMEDPTPAENQEAFRLIRQHTTTPIAVGEVLSSIWDVQHLITEQLIDYVRTTVVHAGGITHLRRIFDLAALYQVRTGSHGATDLSPITLAAAVHVDTAVPNFGIQEYMPHVAETMEVFRSEVRFEDGMLHPADVPGLGIEYDDEAAERFPYERRYLPVARRLDGSVHDW